ncbi:MAG: glycosyltransferase [Chloroflexota bacterium]
MARKVNAVPGRIKVLSVIGTVGLGGSERQLYLLMKHIDRQVFDPHVLVFNRIGVDVLEPAFQQAGVALHWIPPDCTGIYRRTRFITGLLKDLKPHIVHSWTAHDNPYAAVCGGLSGTPLRLGSIRTSLKAPSFSELPAAYRWASLHSTGKLVVNSQSLVEELQAAGLAESKLYRLPNCVEISPLPEQPRLPADLGIAPGRRVIAMVANLHATKNHFMFIDALAQVADEFPDVLGLIVGQPIPSEPEMPERLQAAIHTHRLERRVILAGLRSDVPELLPACYAFCLTSYTEGLSNALMEAMAAGLPVVATRVNGAPELVREGETGYLVPPDDVTSLAAYLRFLLSNPEAAHRMGQAGRQRMLDHFSPQQVTRQIEAFYQAGLGCIAPASSGSREPAN